ncbi:unnamed protein product [Protopolystoma xenopodis]|uniref:Uncharacterized protein n=1 Tax=Protopolystoma xenopodis TaxID=117903 RepID=A0A3S5ASM3_9PLAT|nr:unnamed protein product [Protopolystoma xenopodis]
MGNRGSGLPPFGTWKGHLESASSALARLGWIQKQTLVILEQGAWVREDEFFDVSLPSSVDRGQPATKPPAGNQEEDPRGSRYRRGMAPGSRIWRPIDCALRPTRPRLHRNDAEPKGAQAHRHKSTSQRWASQRRQLVCDLTVSSSQKTQKTELVGNELFDSERRGNWPTGAGLAACRRRGDRSKWSPRQPYEVPGDAGTVDR